MGLGRNSFSTCMFSFAEMASFVVIIHFSHVVGCAPFYQKRAAPIEDRVSADCAMLCNEILAVKRSVAKSQFRLFSTKFGKKRLAFFSQR